MTNLAEKLDFSGHTISCGIDVHLKSWTVSLYLGRQYLKSFVQSPPSVDGLWNFLLTNYPKARYECAYESGFCGFWIQRAFAVRSISCIAVNAADVPRTDKGTKNKNDRNDSRRIAEALQAGQLAGLGTEAGNPNLDQALGFALGIVRVQYRSLIGTGAKRSPAKPELSVCSY